MQKHPQKLDLRSAFRFHQKMLVNQVKMKNQARVKNQVKVNLILKVNQKVSQKVKKQSLKVRRATMVLFLMIVGRVEKTRHKPTHAPIHKIGSRKDQTISLKYKKEKHCTRILNFL